MKRQVLSDRLAILTKRLFVDNSTDANTHPFLKASLSWKIVADQLKDLLGKAVYRQWFREIRPVIASEGILILKTPNIQTKHWVNNHYQELIDLLLSFQDKNLSSFFVCEEDMVYHTSVNGPEVVTSLKDQSNEQETSTITSIYY